MIAEREIIMYQTVLNSVSDGVLMVDCSGKIIVLNPSAKRILGIQLSDLFGKTFAELFFDKEEHDAFNQLFLEAIQNKEVKDYTEVPMIRRDGRKVTIGVTMSLLQNKEKQTLGVLAIFKEKEKD